MIRRPFSRTSHLPCSCLTMASLPVATMALMASITPWGITVPLSSFIRRFSRRCFLSPNDTVSAPAKKICASNRVVSDQKRRRATYEKTVWKRLFSSTDYNKYYILYQVISTKHNSILQLNRYQNGLFRIVTLFALNDRMKSTNNARESAISSFFTFPTIE